MYHAQPPLTDITFVAFDTETTGLFPIMHRLVETGAVRFRLHGHELATFQTLIDPHTPIPPNVQQAHGNSDAMMRGRPTIKTIADVMRVSQPLTFADAPVCAMDLPAGFKALSTAMAEQCTITIVYESGWQRSGPRKITPRLVLEVQGVAYVIAHCIGARRRGRLDWIASERVGSHRGPGFRGAWPFPASCGAASGARPPSRRLSPAAVLTGTPGMSSAVIIWRSSL